MKTLGMSLLYSIVILSMTFCGNKTGNTEEKAAERETEKAVTESVTEGHADITLSAGGETYKITGPCGWASAMGVRYIGAKDAGNSMKTFSAFFNLENLPSSTTTYTLIKSNIEDTDPSHITMNITEMQGNKLFEYTSTNESGKLTLVVSGNKVTADLSGITLKPATGDNPMFPSLNTGAFSKTGTLSGTLEFSKY